MKFLIFFSLFIIPFLCFSQHAIADYEHVKYGLGENNWLNIYLAEGEGKRPLLVFAHANGSAADRFRLEHNFGKQELYKFLINFIQSNINQISINLLFK
jgi:hypothetical protein